MGQLVQETLEALRRVGTPGVATAATDAAWFAGDLLARFHSDDRWMSGFADIDAEPVDAEDAQQLKQALLDAIPLCRNLALRSSLLRALSQTRDLKLQPFYVAEMEAALHAVEGGSCALLACLDAIESLGEQAYEWENGATSQSPFDVEKNIRQARKYLQNRSGGAPSPFPFGAMQSDTGEAPPTP